MTSADTCNSFSTEIDFIAAPPEKSKANKELVRFLAKILNLPNSAVTITSGLRDAKKKVHISNITAEKLLKQLKPYL